MLFGLFVVVLQVPLVHCESVVHEVTVSVVVTVVVLYGAQTRGVPESAERPAQLASRVQPTGQQTPGFGRPITPWSPLVGESGSAGLMLKTVPAVAQSEADDAEPRQKPSFALKPETDWASSMACSVAPVMQVPLSQSLPPVHFDPATPLPLTGEHAARHEEPLWVGCGSQLRPRPPSAVQSASSRQLGSQEATRLDL
ncbi:MAG: hypothetical protein E6J88_14240 [Deltaproteobacteria bacterium]|nr:MAG: hypothetical protein E6J88_14240 [Deltaproteobacteria bacterium]